MPFVLDYDDHGNVIGGHFVEVLPDRHLQLLPNHLNLDMAGNENRREPSDRPPGGTTNMTQPNPPRLNTRRTTGPRGAPPIAPAAMRDCSQARHQANQTPLRGDSYRPSYSHLPQHPQQQYWAGRAAASERPMSRTAPEHTASRVGVNNSTRRPAERRASRAAPEHPSSRAAEEPSTRRPAEHPAIRAAVEHPTRYRSIAPRPPSLSSASSERRPSEPASRRVAAAKYKQDFALPPQTPQFGSFTVGASTFPQLAQTGRESIGSSQTPNPLMPDKDIFFNMPRSPQGSLRTFPEIPPPADNSRPSFTLRSPQRTLATFQPPADTIHPAQRMAPTNPIDPLAKPRRFANEFAAHFKQDSSAMTKFEAVCMLYNRGQIDEIAVFAGVYGILYRKHSLHLWPAFEEFLPPAWKNVDLSWFHQAIENDFLQRFEENAEEAERQKKAEEAQRQAMVSIPKKKRPVNGFKTGDSHNVPSSRSGLMQMPPGFHGPATPPSEDDFATAPAFHGHPKTVNPSALVKLPIISQTIASPRPASKTTSTRKTTSKKRKVPADTPPSFKGKNRYTSLKGSAVPHVGPLYPTRRAVLARSGQPYIHHACGQGFAHPQDVKAHEKKVKGCRVQGKEWNDHPSCKVDYPQLKYCQVKDGYVILDQASFDLLETAIAEGKKYHREKKKMAGEEIEVDYGEETQSDPDAEFEVEEDTQMVDAAEEEAEMRAAALGLRKRSTRE